MGQGWSRGRVTGRVQSQGQDTEESTSSCILGQIRVFCQGQEPQHSHEGFLSLGPRRVCLKLPRPLPARRTMAVSRCAVASGPTAAGSTACRLRAVAANPTKLRSHKPSAARVSMAWSPESQAAGPRSRPVVGVRYSAG